MLKGLSIAALLGLALVAGCATTSRTTVTSAIPNRDFGRSGQVVSVTQTVERVQGNPAGGALVGGVIGGLAFREPLGAAAGAATGAAVSAGSSERREYLVHVQFDDGSVGRFDYIDTAPFVPGDRVVVTPSGLARV